MPLGKLGPVLQVNLTMDLCTYDNTSLISPASSSCKPWIQTAMRRGEQEQLWRMSGTLYGGQICFAYSAKSVVTGVGASTSQGCVSTCFDANMKDLPWLIEDIHMKCTQVMGVKSCRGTIKYMKVTLDQGAFPTRYTSAYCDTDSDRLSDEEVKESIKLKVKDCMMIISPSSQDGAEERCDDVLALKMKEIKNGKTTPSQELWINKNEGRVELRFLPVEQRVWVYFKGGHNFCVTVSKTEKTINGSKDGSGKPLYRHECWDSCQRGWVGDQPATLEYYEEKYNIVGQSHLGTKKILKFYPSAAVAPYINLHVMLISMLINCGFIYKLL